MDATDTTTAPVVHYTHTGFYAGQTFCGAARGLPGCEYAHAGYTMPAEMLARVCGDCAHVWDCERDPCERCTAILSD